MNKKKVSFDIDPKLLDTIKKLCKQKEIKVADFFRDASLKKLEREKFLITIFVPIDGKVKKFTIEKIKYEIDLFSASEIMKINVSAQCEGVLRFINNYQEKDIEIDKIINKSIDKKINFYTTEKYC